MYRTFRRIGLTGRELAYSIKQSLPGYRLEAVGWSKPGTPLDRVVKLKRNGWVR